MRPIQFLLLTFVLAALTKVIHSYTQRGMRKHDFLLWALIWIGTAAIITFSYDFVIDTGHEWPPQERDSR
jgi:hypothetical protein